MARGADGGQGDGLKRIDWVLVIINEMPELVESGLSDSEEIEAGDELGEEEMIQGDDDQRLEDDVDEDGLDDESPDSGSEITMAQVEGEERKDEVVSTDEDVEDPDDDGGSSEEEVTFGDGD